MVSACASDECIKHQFGVRELAPALGLPLYHQRQLAAALNHRAEGFDGEPSSARTTPRLVAQSPQQRTCWLPHRKRAGLSRKLIRKFSTSMMSLVSCSTSAQRIESAIRGNTETRMSIPNRWFLKGHNLGDLAR